MELHDNKLACESNSVGQGARKRGRMFRLRDQSDLGELRVKYQGPGRGRGEGRDGKRKRMFEAGWERPLEADWPYLKN